MVSYYSFLIVLDELINSNNRTDLQIETGGDTVAPPICRKAPASKTAPPTSKASIQPVRE